MGPNSSIPLSCFCRRRLACEGDAIEKTNQRKKREKEKWNSERRGGMKMEEEKEQQE